jgi:CubicO group peptidase (beta-lactamase class C family)
MPLTHTRRVIARLAAGLFVLALVVPAQAQTKDLATGLAAIEKTLLAKQQEYRIPGVALAIIKDDKIVYIKGHGLRDVEHKLPVTPETLFAIGSTSKAFTATTVLMSADEGKLALTDSPKKYLPYFKLQDPEADSKITIGDLLSHRSGLDRTDLAWYTGKLNSEQIIRVAGAAKPTAKLGEKFQYQNVMFLTAGQIVAKVQGTSWTDFVAKRIFKPLGMVSTNTSVPKTQRSDDYALGYFYNDDTKQSVHLPMRDIAAVAPAGAINSNAKDMAQWVRFLLNGGTYGGKRLVSERSFAEMTVPRITIAGAVKYGYGWMLRNWNGHAVAEHGGNIDGFNAHVALMPDQKVGFVMLTNVSASPLGNVLMDSVWTNLVGAPEKPSGTIAAGNTGGGTPTPPSASVEAAQETGTYKFPQMEMIVAMKDGKLTAGPTGQPSGVLVSLGGRRYKPQPPAPEGITVTFRPAQDDPKATEMVLEMPEVTLVGKRAAAPPAFTPPISVDALMQKVVQALGGEANLRRHHSMTLKFALDLENQGITGEGVQIHQAPNSLVENVTWRAAGTKIATVREYCDGTRAGTEMSFTMAAPKTGTALTDALIEADFYPELNWKQLFKTVVVKSMGKVGDEEVFVVVKTPEKGTPITDHYSTKSFLLLKREQGPASVTYSDYRPVNGVMVAFKREGSAPGMGSTVTTIKEVKLDVKVADSVFAPTQVRTASSTAQLSIYD